MLNRSCSIKVIRSARLAPTMPLALHNLTTEVWDVWISYWLVQMHLCLDMMSISPLVQPSHLDVLDLCLCNTRAFSWEKLLLMLLVGYTMLHFMRFWCGAFGLRKLLVHYVRLSLRVIALVDLVRWYLDTSSMWLDGLGILMTLTRARWPVLRITTTMALYMHYSRRRWYRHLLRL